MPDPFVLAITLSVLVLAAGVLFGRTPDEVGAAGGPVARLMPTVAAWGKGLWSLLPFTMQMCTMLVLGSALADAPVVRRGLVAIVELPRRPRTLVATVCAAAITLGLVNWSLGLVGGAVLAREASRAAKRRGIAVDGPLLVAAAYATMMTWHGGLSGSAPLKVTSEAGLAEILGLELASSVGAIGLDRTIFGARNLLVTGGLLILGPLIFAAMTPRDGDGDARPLPDLEEPLAPSSPSSEDRERRGVTSETIAGLEATWGPTALLVIPMLLAISVVVARGGLARLDLDTVNLLLWVGAMLAHGRTSAFVSACERGITGCVGVVLQFPLYGAIMGVMAHAGFVDALSNLAVGAGQSLFSWLVFLSAGVINLFVPSGGGQWAVQGPIVARAALTLGVPVEHAVMGVAYGDQWTNMLQPFWATPLLALTGARPRDFVGYAAIYLVVGGVWISVVCLWWP
jgi:short-chain fatty acids transporter